MIANPVEIDTINWFEEIENHRYEGFRVGGLLSIAVLLDVITSDKLNDIFRQIATIPSKPRSYFLNGYLGWKFSHDAKCTEIQTSSTVKPLRRKKYFERLFTPLNHESLQLLLPAIDNDYFDLMMRSSDIALFKRCWKAIRKLADATLQSAVYEHLRTKNAGIKKAACVASNWQLSEWISGKLTKPLFDAPAEQVNRGDTEFEVLKDISSRILPKDLFRVWDIIQKVRDKASLQVDSSLGIAILQGVQLRSDATSEPILELCESINRVVYEQGIFATDKVDIALPGLKDLRYEFFTGNPFENWTYG